MTFDELCTIAGNGRPFPRSASALERITYRGLTWLYRSYRRGAFSKDEAAEEKELLRRDYEDAQKECENHMKLFHHIDDIRVAFGGQFKEVQQSGCPVCKRLVEILDGRNLIPGDRKEINDENQRI